MHSVARASASDDRTAKARIRDAAIARFANDGVHGTSVRAIAEDAEVSPALVIHHFGSKDALRQACDRYVVDTIRHRKQTAMATGPGLDPVAAVRDLGDGPPLLAYLARTLIDGSPEVDAMIDEMVDDAVGYMGQGVESGVLQPTDHPYERAAVLTVWSLGALALHAHVERLLGVDLLGDPEQLARATGYFAPALEILAQGALTVEAAARMRSALSSNDPSQQEATP